MTRLLMLVSHEALEYFIGWLEFANAPRMPGVAYCAEWPRDAKVRHLTQPPECVRESNMRDCTHAFEVTTDALPFSVRACWMRSGCGYVHWTPSFSIDYAPLDGSRGRHQVTVPFSAADRLMR